VGRTWRSLLAASFVVASTAGCQPAPSPAPAAPTPSSTGPSAPVITTAQPSDSISLVGRLGSLRAAHSATTLADGRVLIAGGCTEDSCEGISASTELLNPATGASSAGPSMLEPRVSHAAVRLPDGRVLMVGGFQPGTETASTEIFDSRTNSFVAGPTLLEPLADPLVVLLRDGRILVAGGFSNHASVASAEILDPALTAFQATGSMSTPRSSHGGALLADGRVIVIGGNTRGDTGTVLASAEIYDPVTGSWSETGSMSVPRHKLAVVALADARVLALGGSNEQDALGQYRSAEIWNRASNTFAPTGDMSAPRYKISGAVVRLDDGRVLVAGGSRRAELYDPSTETFRPVAGDVDVGFNFAAAAQLPDGSVLVSGGYDAGIHLTDQVLRFIP
jgi:hypothetical protein